eukprot:6196500-Pleurochrysis_carterae.AAC.3
MDGHGSSLGSGGGGAPPRTCNIIATGNMTSMPRPSTFRGEDACARKRSAGDARGRATHRS